MSYIITPGGEAWEDLRVPVSATKGAGVKDPTFAQFRDDGVSSIGVFTYQFDFLQRNELFFQVQIPHSYKEGSDLYPHVHWSPTVSGTVGSVVWGLEFTAATISGTWPTTSTYYVAAPTDGNEKHQIANFPVISGGSFGISTMLSCRIFRDVDSVSDDYPQLASLHEIDFHFIQNTSGSTGEYTK